MSAELKPPHSIRLSAKRTAMRIGPPIWSPAASPISTPRQRSSAVVVSLIVFSFCPRPALTQLLSNRNHGVAKVHCQPPYAQRFIQASKRSPGNHTVHFRTKAVPLHPDPPWLCQSCKHGGGVFRGVQQVSWSKSTTVPMVASNRPPK
jgi:hypothetical protein